MCIGCAADALAFACVEDFDDMEKRSLRTAPVDVTARIILWGMRRYRFVPFAKEAAQLWLRADRVTRRRDLRVLQDVPDPWYPLAG